MPRASEAERIKRANARYHDAVAGVYDEKWGISYGEVGRAQVVAKVSKALGTTPARFGRGLEIGAGTGYFTLNLLRAGVIREALATDISPGMLDVLAESAGSLGLPVEVARCDATELPVPDSSIDLVFGHAVLHHLPNLDDAFSEFRRVLRPGGTLVFCGEPSFYGDLLAAVPKRAALAVAPLWRAVMRAGARRNGREPLGDEGKLEMVVDVHAFTPSRLGGHARRAGFDSVRVSGEELAASWFGWINRSLESTAVSDEVPWIWRQYAYRGYLALQALDRVVLEPRLPPTIFYNLLISARAPERP
jgi:ubiquinone/menaquinone biosynthesis C-methylase UbiE